MPLLAGRVQIGDRAPRLLHGEHVALLGEERHDLLQQLVGLLRLGVAGHGLLHRVLRSRTRRTPHGQPAHASGEGGWESATRGGRALPVRLRAGSSLPGGDDAERLEVK